MTGPLPPGTMPVLIGFALGVLVEVLMRRRFERLVRENTLTKGDVRRDLLFLDIATAAGMPSLWVVVFEPSWAGDTALSAAAVVAGFAVGDLASFLARRASGRLAGKPDGPGDRDSA